MKLKASLTDKGLNLLEKRFIPALEKVGKVCHLLLSQDHIIFLHNLLSPDGVQSISDFSTPSLFYDFHISSRNHDRIAFSLDLSLLHRALRTSASNPTRLHLKLVKKLTPASPNHYAPFLSLHAKAHTSALLHDVPISTPLSAHDLHHLHAALDGARALPRTMVHFPDMHMLSRFTERMKPIGDEIRVCVSRDGGIDFRMSTTLISVGAEMSGLLLLPDAAEEEDAGMEVTVRLKNFCSCLGLLAARPDAAFYGVGAEGGFLVVVFQFFVPGTTLTDKSISLHCRVPVLDPGGS